MAKRYKEVNAPKVVAIGDGWVIQYDQHARDFIASIEHEMDMRPIAFCRTQTEAQTKINQYRFEEVS